MHTGIGRHMSMGLHLHECMGLGSSRVLIHVQDCNKSGVHESKLVGPTLAPLAYILGRQHNYTVYGV